MRLSAAIWQARNIQLNIIPGLQGELSWYGLGALGNRGYQSGVSMLKTAIEDIYEELGYCRCCKQKVAA